MRLSAFASVKLTIALMSLIGVSILIGAWCPQESQSGFQKVVETFGESSAVSLRQWGITDIFHTPFFLLLIAFLTLNMIACSVQRVFPKARQMKQKMKPLASPEISKFPNSIKADLNCPAADAMSFLALKLQKQGYKVEVKDGKLTAEWAKIALLAATVTHIGLLSLLAGVTITSWTGFNGFRPVMLDETMSFGDSEHSKLWIGKLPTWKLRVDETRRENYESGEAKQWYSKLSVIDEHGKVLKQQEISVNNPLSYDGVDVYQSSWGLGAIKMSFNGKNTELNLRQMGNANAAFMPLDEKTVLIFSLRGQDQPLRVFAKIPEWQAPKMLAEIPKGFEAKFGQVRIGYIKPLPVTGLQYKSDPGLPITYFAFGVIMLGVMMAAFPHRQVWACAVESEAGKSSLFACGLSRKGKTLFNRSLQKLSLQLKEKFGESKTNEMPDAAEIKDNDIHASAGTAG
ncbi:MAG: cytochrome c biogenesis protein ResB [Candidatus Obscuribacterales bacterium]|nr:cytochrome c biogenesis protein ResB [Candidatus Obscuribacterales bacterium]